MNRDELETAVRQELIAVWNQALGAAASGVITVPDRIGRVADAVAVVLEAADAYALSHAGPESMSTAEQYRIRDVPGRCLCHWDYRHGQARWERTIVFPGCPVNGHATLAI